MKLFKKYQRLIVYLLILTFFSSLGCSYKPNYLKKSGRTGVSERWLVKKIDEEKLSPDEKAIWERYGPPQYIRFFRQLSPQREKVYEWIYTEPLNLFTFVEGKEVPYVVVDEDPSPFNEHQRQIIFWGGITAGLALGAGLIYLYAVGNK
ncbi:MAG: hypothetical protein ACPL5I_11885 [Thermodesulfobacteriota bacterium]